MVAQSQWIAETFPGVHLGHHLSERMIPDLRTCCVEEMVRDFPSLWFLAGRHRFILSEVGRIYSQQASRPFVCRSRAMQY